MLLLSQDSQPHLGPSNHSQPINQSQVKHTHRMVWLGPLLLLCAVDDCPCPSEPVRKTIEDGSTHHKQESCLTGLQETTHVWHSPCIPRHPLIPGRAPLAEKLQGKEGEQANQSLILTWLSAWEGARVAKSSPGRAEGLSSFMLVSVSAGAVCLLLPIGDI